MENQNISETLKILMDTEQTLSDSLSSKNCKIVELENKIKLLTSELEHLKDDVCDCTHLWQTTKCEVIKQACEEKGLNITRLQLAFPKGYFYLDGEFITYPENNTFFIINDVNTQEELDCKVLESCSREACKSEDYLSELYHTKGLETYFNRTFTSNELESIYKYLGNRCNRKLCKQFLKENFNFDLITEKKTNTVYKLFIGIKLADEQAVFMEFKTKEDMIKYIKGTGGNLNNLVCMNDEFNTWICPTD